MKKQANQVSLAGVAMQSKNGKRKRPIRWKVVLPIALAVVVVAVAVFAIIGRGQKGPSLTAREMVQYTPTPDAISSDVSYYVLGITGDNATDCMDMVAVMCFNRKAGTVSFLQMPVATYINRENGFDTPLLGEVWGRPQPVTFCETCRCNVKDADVEGGNHKTCGTPVVKRTGSSFSDLCRVINTQYGLPTDNYLVIPRKGLALLIDKLGGVDVELDGNMTVDTFTYEKGVRTLTGAAAVQYITTHQYTGTPQSDRARMLRQRQVLAAVLQRLSTYKVNDLYNPDNTSKGILSAVMNSGSPVRFDTTSFGKSRLLGYSESRADGVRFSKALAMFCCDISEVELSKVLCCILPGETAKTGSTTAYTVNGKQTEEVLNTYFKPYAFQSETLTFAVPTLKENPAAVELEDTTLDTVLVEQTVNLNATTTATTTTTTTTGG